MQKCSYCGADLPENTRFCGKCGSVQDALVTDAATISSNTLPPQSWASESGTIPVSSPPSSKDPTHGSVLAWSSNTQAPATPPPLAENEDEQTSGIPPWSPLYGAALGGDALAGSLQASTPGVPIVQGTPQISSAPSVAGTFTPSTNVPVSPPMHGPTSGSFSPPVQEAAQIPVSHPVQGPANAPSGNPPQGPGHAPVSNLVPVSHPVRKPEPTHHPPTQPGTHEHHPHPGPQRHHDHPVQHKQSEQHKQHELHHASKAKVAGGSTVKTIILVATAIVVVAAGGIAVAAHFLMRPQPLISITSNYKVGSTSAGASGTILHISGQNFSSNSPVTFLLDGHAVPGNSSTRSDANGNFSTNVTITDAWSVGAHTLTARDASNDSPKNSISVTIVQPGQANTLGPNGAPPDDATFRIKVTIANGLADPFSQNPVLIITGHPDPEGGTVCSPDDSGQSLTYNEIAANGTTSFTKTITASCNGTYKVGQINFIETSTTIKQYWQYSGGVNVTCVLPKPTVDLRLTGAYVGNNTFRGTLSSPYFTYTCDQGNNTYHEAAQGVTWTGTMVTQ